eukprot:jgi/Orpsp1_1/1177595/evm.model.c7180000062056.2
MMKINSNNKIVPKIYGYILIFFGLFLNNVAEALPVVLKRDDNVDVEGNKQKAIQKIVGALAVITGFCICFFGHQFYNKIIFFIGFAAGVFVTKSILGSVWSDVNDLVFYITAIIIGIIFGSLAICAYKVSLCILGVLAGYGVSAILIAFIPDLANKINPILLTLIVSIIFIILIFVCEIPIIIIATGIAGSYMIFYGIDTVINTGLAQALQTMYDSKSFANFQSSLSVRAMVIASLVVAILGWVVQFITYRNNKDAY